MSEKSILLTTAAAPNRGCGISDGAQHFEALSACARMAHEVAQDFSKKVALLTDKEQRSETNLEGKNECNERTLLDDAKLAVHGGLDLIKQTISEDARLTKWAWENRNNLVDGAAVSCLMAGGTNYYQAKDTVCIVREAARACKNNIVDNPCGSAVQIWQSPKSFVLDSITHHR